MSTLSHATILKMSADEPLEDDPWDHDLPRYSERFKTFVIIETIAVGAAITVGIWFATHDVAVLIIGAITTPLMAIYIISMFRNGRLWRWSNTTDRGEYRGPWWLGAQAETRA